jgi:superfamily II DNA or RNA helicase
LINWVARHIESKNSVDTYFRIGQPLPEFWSKWKTSKEKLKEQGYIVFKDRTRGKSEWYVKKPIHKIDKPYLANNKAPKVKKDYSLYWYQKPHLQNMLNAFQNSSGVADGSDTGTGKTITAVALCKELNLKHAIICPLAVIPSWVKWCKKFEVEPVFIANYEAFKINGNKYGKNEVHFYPFKVCKFLGIQAPPNDVYTTSKQGCIKYLEKNVRSDFKQLLEAYKRVVKKPFPWAKMKEKQGFKWNIPQNTIMIFDEAHKCKGPYTINCDMLIASKKFPTLMLSATLGKSPRDLRGIGYILGLHNLYDFNKWTMGLGCYVNKWDGWECDSPLEAMLNVNKMIFPLRGSRMKISDIPDFPENLIIAEGYQSDIRDNFNDQYYKLLERIDQLEEMGNSTTEIFAEIIRFRQRAELLKVPLFVELAKDAIENQKSVAIFVNYTETRIEIQKAFNTNCAIYGDQSEHIREQNIQSFQHGLERVIVVNSTAGGVGVSLHDEYGNYPRESIISPTYDAVIFKQVLGRIHRAGAKSKAIQRIPYLADTIEMKICESVNKKLDNMSAFNDGDLMESDLLKFKKVG